MKWLRKQLQCFSFVPALVPCRLPLLTPRHGFGKKGKLNLKKKKREKKRKKRKKEIKQQNRVSL